MLDYGTTMLGGAQAYREELDALRAAGITAAFTQTGGMNAALEAILDGGAVLLITDAEDSLSWVRSEQHGWGVGLYRDAELQDPVSFDSTPRTDTTELLHLVRGVLARAARAPAPSSPRPTPA